MTRSAGGAGFCTDFENKMPNEHPTSQSHSRRGLQPMAYRESPNSARPCHRFREFRCLKKIRGDGAYCLHIRERKTQSDISLFGTARKGANSHGLVVSNHFTFFWRFSDKAFSPAKAPAAHTTHMADPNAPVVKLPDGRGGYLATVGELHHGCVGVSHVCCVGCGRLRR